MSSWCQSNGEWTLSTVPLCEGKFLLVILTERKINALLKIFSSTELPESSSPGRSWRIQRVQSEHNVVQVSGGFAVWAGWSLPHVQMWGWRQVAPTLTPTLRTWVTFACGRVNSKSHFVWVTLLLSSWMSHGCARQLHVPRHSLAASEKNPWNSGDLHLSSLPGHRWLSLR